MKSTVCIVEDVELIRESLKEMLISEYNIVAFENGNDLIKYLETNVPDLILLDIMLPSNMDGFSILRYLKRNPTLQAIPVIILSALDSDEKVTMGLELGANDYIAKPFKLNNVFLKIKNQLALKKVNDAKLELTSLPENIIGQEPSITYNKNKFEKILENYLDKPDLSIDFIASEMSMSISTFERWMKKVYQSNPKKYILMYKLSKAEILLRQNRGSVADIAYLIGFNSVSHFCSSFKSYYGKSPLRYIKENNM